MLMLMLPSSGDELMLTIDVMRKRCVIGSFQLLIVIA